MIRLFGYYVASTYLYLGIIEAGLFFGAFYLGVHTRFGWSLPDDLDAAALLVTASVFAGVMSSAMMAMGLYQRGVQEQKAGFAARIGSAFLFGTSLLMVLFYIFPHASAGRAVIGVALLLSLASILVARKLFARVVSAETRKRRVLVLGAGRNAQGLEMLQHDDPGVGFRITGYIPLAEGQPMVPEWKVVEGNSSLLELVIATETDEIVVAADDRRRGLPVSDLLDCKMSGFEVLDLLTFFEKELAIVKIDSLHPSWIFFSTGFKIGLTGLYGKRLFDLAVAGLMLIAGSPVMLLVAAASLVESRGRDPVFYRQVRAGQNGKLFHLYKFRSMRTDAEADGVARWADENDSRITRLGAFLRKTRLDELPQIFNVLRGEMSLVGPRPERPEFVEQLGAAIPYYSERHRVKPGVTGWAQLRYPYGSGVEDAKRKLEFDLYYVKHAGILLDLVILLQTVEVVLFGKGAR